MIRRVLMAAVIVAGTLAFAVAPAAPAAAHSTVGQGHAIEAVPAIGASGACPTPHLTLTSTELPSGVTSLQWGCVAASDWRTNYLVVNGTIPNPKPATYLCWRFAHTIPTTGTHTGCTNWTPGQALGGHTPNAFAPSTVTFNCGTGSNSVSSQATVICSSGAQIGVRKTMSLPEAWFWSNSATGADYIPPVPPNTERTPAVYCTRSFTEGGGYTFTTLAARVTNPSTYATDAVRWMVEWEPDVWHSSAIVQELEVPDLATMPAGGWRAVCEVTRTITNPSTTVGSSSAATGHTTSNDVSSGSLMWATPPSGPTSPWIVTSPGKTTTVTRPTGLSWTRSLGGIVALLGFNWLRENDPGIGYRKLLERADRAQRDCPWSQYPPGSQAEKDCLAEHGYADPSLRTQTQTQNADGTPTTGTWTKAVTRAEVRINPLQPDKGAENTTATELDVTPQQAEELAQQEASGTASSECDLGFFELLNPLNMGRVLYCSFVPTDEGTGWSEFIATTSETFPFSVAWELDAAADAFLSALGDGLDGDVCASLDFRGAVPEDSRDAEMLEVLEVELPTPSTSGCAKQSDFTAAENEVGDLYGWRVFFRTGLWIVACLAVMSKLVRAFAPGGQRMHQLVHD